MKEKRIFALGFFDGVHLGHQALLRECCRMAAQMGCGTGAITFERHPMSLFTDCVPPLINTLSDRQKLLRQYGMERVYPFPVTETVMSTTWQDFLRELLALGATGFVCGDDFRFGYKGQGNPEMLRQFCTEQGVPCVIVPEQTMDDVRVSSTYIRRQLETGDMETAVRFLGHPHILSGEVVAGQQLGRTIGIPTANLCLPEQVQAPRFGVYCCKVTVDGVVYPAVTNIGTRPTVAGRHVTVEPWLLGFAGDLYGKTLTLAFYRFLRPEQKFESLAALQAEIRKNASQTMEFFKNL